MLKVCDGKGQRRRIDHRCVSRQASLLVVCVVTFILRVDGDERIVDTQKQFSLTVTFRREGEG